MRSANVLGLACLFSFFCGRVVGKYGRSTKDDDDSDDDDDDDVKMLIRNSYKVW